MSSLPNKLRDVFPEVTGSGHRINLDHNGWRDGSSPATEERFCAFDLTLMIVAKRSAGKQDLDGTLGSPSAPGAECQVLTMKEACHS